MRALLLVLALSLGAACGDRVAIDPLAQLEKDPDGVLAAAQPTYKATYDSSTTWSASVYRGVPQPPVTRHMMTVVYAARPPDFRWDLTYDDYLPTKYNLIAHARGGEYCMNAPGPTACYVLEPDLMEFWIEALTDSPWETYRNVIRDMDVTVLPREHIAGRDGACFRWTSRKPLPSRTIDDSFEGCFDSNGVVLRATADHLDMRDEFRAVSISDRVGDADFALPYTTLKAGPWPTWTPQPVPSRTAAPTPTH
jgi:hypothetical protein